MKNILLFLTLFYLVNLSVQDKANEFSDYTKYANYSNYLLFEPDDFDELSVELVAYHLEDYEILKDQLTKEYSEESNIEIKQQIEVDLSKLNTVLELWNNSFANNKIIEFVEKFDEEKCYHIESEMDDLTKVEVTITPVKNETIDQPLLIDQVFDYTFMPRKGGWERTKKSRNCSSPNPEDCYVACYVKYPEKHILTINDQEFIFPKLPSNLSKLETTKVRQQIELFPFQFEVIENKTQKSIAILNWNEVDCEE